MAGEISWVVRRRVAQFDVGGGETVAEFCGRLGISRASFYRLRERFARGGFEALGAECRAPARQGGALGAQVVAAVLAVRKDLDAQGLDGGGRTIRFHLARAGLEPLPSVSSIDRIVRREGLARTNRRKRPRSSWHRFAREQANELWQIDALAHTLPGIGRVSIYQVIDDASRACVALRAYPGGESPDDAISALGAAIAQWGLPGEVLSDNGTAFNTHRRGLLSKTEKYLAKAGVYPISGQVGHPTTQGKTERAHQGVRKWLAAHPAPTLDELNSVLEAYQDTYNHHRPHQALNGITPIEAFESLAHHVNTGQPIDEQDLLTAPVRQQIPVRSRGLASLDAVDIYVGLEHAGALLSVTRLPNHTLHITTDHTTLAILDWPPPTNYLNITPRGPRTPVSDVMR